MDVSLSQPRFTPLLASGGVRVGRKVHVGAWQADLRAGVEYQGELLSSGDVIIQDAAGERRSKGKKDSRLRYSLGMETQALDTLRVGVELERSSLGDYNQDYGVSATLRYTF